MYEYVYINRYWFPLKLRTPPPLPSMICPIKPGFPWPL